MAFFGIDDRSFLFGVKRSQNSMKLELEKGRKIVQLLNFWSFYLHLSVVLHDTPGLILFIGA